MTTMKTTPNLPSRALAIAAAAITIVSAAQAGVTNIKEALATALKNQTIAAAGDKMKLYALSASYQGDTKHWTIQLHDGGTKIHTIHINNTGKTRHSARNKSNLRIFNDLDFSKLPAPTEVLIDDVAAKAKEALSALKFTPTGNGKLHIIYNLNPGFLQKGQPCHTWRVIIPVGDGKKGKTVIFKNGRLDSILTTPITG